MTALKPKPVRAQIACSLDEPQPKLLPARRICAPLASGLFRTKSGSGEPNRKKVASVTWEQIRTIAEDKMPDLNAFTIEKAMSMVAGTARSMGITVSGDAPF